ncbi:MAG: DUF4139 domain-containing protein [Bryobacteraceae bacterium]
MSAKALSRRFVPFLCGAAVVTAADLPVREVTLYKHGVAHFQRAGELKPGDTIRLDFKPGDMNDVLKSLTITDRSGGKVNGVRYDSSDPLEKRLEEYPFQIAGQISLATFLDSVKGAEIEMKLAAQTVTGTVLSGRIVGGNDKEPAKEVVVLMLDSGELRTFDLGAASAIRLGDPKLQSQLKNYLGTLNQSRSRDRRSVYIDGTAAVAREVVAGYMTPAAVWKSSYRLIFNPQGEPVLEGWAIVDNTSGEDWNGVKLAVISGKPVSFISRLYEPRYVSRPVGELAENQAAAPLVYQGGFAEADSKVAAAPPPAVAALGRMASKDALAERELRDRPMNGRQMNEMVAVAPSSIAAAADTRQAGELFEYSFATPVTVKQGESAMIPFLQQKIGGRKLLVYQEGYGLNPRDAAELTNSSGKTLDGGPITVYDAGTYAGEALVETLPMGDKRLISYGVDLGTRVTTAFDSAQAIVREIHFRRGILTTKSAVAETKTYTIKNADAKAKTLIIEHLQRPGYKLIDLKPLETTADAYRFEVKLTASATDKFAVREERVFDQSTAVSSMTPDVLASYVQNKTLTDAARRQLEQIAAKKREVAANNGALQQADKDIDVLTQDQGRIRNNMESLNRVNGQQQQVQQYANQLATTETRLAAQRDRQAELRRMKNVLESELNNLMERIEF